MQYNHSIPTKAGGSQLGGINDSVFTTAHYKSTAGGNQTLMNETSIGSSPVVGAGNLRTSSSIGLRENILGGGS